MTDFEKERQEKLSEWQQKRKAEEEKSKYLLKALKKSVSVKDYTSDEIESCLAEIINDCGDTAYIMDSDRDLLQDLVGDDRAIEFEMAFVYLSEDAERFQEDYFPQWGADEDFEEFYNSFVVTSAVGNTDMMFYDEYIGDWHTLDNWEQGKAGEFADNRIMKLTKQKIIELSRKAFGLILRWTALKTDYDRLSGVMDILKGEGSALLAQIKEIEEAYEKANAVESRKGNNDVRQFERLVSHMPDQVWLE